MQFGEMKDSDPSNVALFEIKKNIANHLIQDQSDYPYCLECDYHDLYLKFFFKTKEQEQKMSVYLPYRS